VGLSAVVTEQRLLSGFGDDQEENGIRRQQALFETGLAPSPVSAAATA
jgi:hypothetical protein